MKTIAVVTLALLLAALGSSADEITTTHISGTIVDDATGAPLPDARIVVFAVSVGKEPAPGHVESVRVDIRPSPEGRFQADLKPTWSGPGRAYVIANARGHVEIRPEWKPTASPGYETGRPIELALRLKRGPTLSGTVVDEAGHPVGGARVELTLSGPSWCGWPQSFSMGQEHWPDDTVTDARGRWEMLAFPIAALSTPGRHQDGQFVITVEHDRYVPVIVPAVERMPQLEHVIEIKSTMRAGRSIRGRVLDARGKPASEAVVELTGSARVADPRCHDFRKKVLAGKDGQFTVLGLDEREWTVTATAASDGPSDPKTITASERGPLELRLAPGGEITGRVRDETGRPMAGEKVYLNGPRRFASTTTAADGSFRFAKLPRGKFTVGAYQIFERDVEVPGPFVDVALELRRQLFVKLVAKEDGKPILPPATVHFRGMNSSWLVELPPRSTDGIVDAGALYPGIYELYADVPGRASTGGRFKLLRDKREPARPTIEVPLGFTLRGQVRNRDGRPVPGATVNASAGLYGERTSTTDSQGVYELKGLNSSYLGIGSGYYLSVEADGFAPWDSLEMFVRVDADRRLDITLDRGATVRGRVVFSDGRPATHVEVKVSGERTFLMTTYFTPASMPSAVTDADGRYVLEHVPFGDITLVSESASKKVKTEDGKDLTVDWTL